MKNKTTLYIIFAVLFVVGFSCGIVLGLNKKNNESSSSENIINIDEINDIYNLAITKNYTDIRELSEDYTVDDAIEDNCFVVTTKVYNDNLYTEFMNNYNEKESAFIRVVETTVEGDLIITDVLYDSSSNLIYLVKDDTRDEFSSEDDRTIKYMTYENIGIWQGNNNDYWVVYNNEIPANIDDAAIEDFFIITAIN